MGPLRLHRDAGARALPAREMKRGRKQSETLSGALSRLLQHGARGWRKGERFAAGKVPDGLGQSRFNHVKLNPIELALCLKNAG